MALRFFTAYTRRYLRKHFHSLRVLRAAPPPADDARPLVVFLNHSSWWDPLACLLLAQTLFPRRTVHAPIEAAMLKRYAILGRLGLFAVEPNTPRGAREFLRKAEAILPSPAHALWLTPQGRFVDPRERPLRFAPGLAALARRFPDARFLPLALEYTYWTEPRPEILAAFGEPVVPLAETARSIDGWSALLADRLEQAQDDLAARSCRRDPAEWREVNCGGGGMPGIYAWCLRLRARLSGKRYRAEHASHPQP
jgi:1-acyl-sn-glycerol-3-phosphate acyltransferase